MSGEWSPEDLIEEDAPIDQVALPMSITQEAEEDRLRKRFGREALPDRTAAHDKVVLGRSGGATGPRPMRRWGVTLFVVLLLVGAAVLAFFYLESQGLAHL